MGGGGRGVEMTRGVELQDSTACVYIASKTAQLMPNTCMATHYCSIVVSPAKGREVGEE